MSVYSYFKVSNGMCGWKGFKLSFLFSQHLVLVLICREFEVLFYRLLDYLISLFEGTDGKITCA